MVFFWNNEVFRAISSDSEALYKKILSSEIAEELFNAGLVKTEIANISLEGYNLVLNHERIPVVSYPTEWCGSMLKDAALLTLDLSIALAKRDLELQDAHPWNILFNRSRPFFIDFGSIIPAKQVNGWRPFKEFIRTFYNPLILMSNGLHEKARASYIDPKTMRGNQISRGDVIKIMLSDLKIKEVFSGLPKIKIDTTSSKIKILQSLRESVEKITIPLSKTAWSDYCEEEVDLSTVSEWIPKRKTAYEAIEKIRPKTVLDIGSNTGWFSKLSATLGARVTSFDVDEPSINKLYQNDVARKMDILPLSMNFTNPTPAYGIELRCKPAVERFKCEFVIILAIVHHLVFKQNVDFNFIIKNLTNYTEKWLLVEFIPREDKYVAKWKDNRFPWYTKESFEKELNKFYSNVQELPSNPSPRIIYLCEL